MKSVQKPSVVPVYAVAAVWLIYTVLLGMHSLWQLLLCGGISAAVYFLLKARFPGRTVLVEVPEKAPDTGNEELDKVILQGRQSVRRIQELDEKIPDEKISAQLRDIASTTGKIFQHLEVNKSGLRQCRQFLGYYLPTTIRLVEQYVRLQDQGVSDGNIAGAMAKIEGMLVTIQNAFRRQLDNLFAADAVDITADIEVMQQMMQANGLTDE